MPKTKILFSAIIFFAISFTLLASSAQAVTNHYNYTIKDLLDKPFDVCCVSSPAQCLANIGPVTPENISNYYPEFIGFSELEQLMAKQNYAQDSYKELSAQCLKQSGCTLGKCPAGVALGIPTNQCGLQNLCKDANQFCKPEIVPNTCVSKYQTGHDCLNSFQCISGDCIKYEYKCAQKCTKAGGIGSDGGCPNNYFCDPGLTCQPSLEGDNLCKSNKACLSEVCYFGICQEPAYCKTDADCETDFYCRTDKTPKICKEKKYSWETCAKDNECVSGKCLYQKCIIVEDQCKKDENCSSTDYCDISSMPKKCLSKKAPGKSCTANTANQCLSGKCVSGKCADTDKCQKDTDCGDGKFCKSAATNKICEDKKNNNSGCAVNEECLSGYCDTETVPGSGTCKDVNPEDHECTKDANCELDYFCDKSGAFFKCVAVKSKDAPCQKDGDCESGQCGSTGQCITLGGCYADKDCSEGKKCNTASHLCEKAAPSECEVIKGFLKIECTVDQYCSVGTCVNKKDVGGDCEIGGHCKSNFCHPVEKKCKDVPKCGNGIVEYEEECDPATTTPDAEKAACDNCKIKPEAVIGCKEDKNCGQDYFCDTTTTKCIKKIANGELCAIAFPETCKSGNCDAKTSKCAPKPAAAGGAAKPGGPILCDTKKYPSPSPDGCPATHYCDTSKDPNECQVKKLAGVSCTTPAECLYQTCPSPALKCGCTANSHCNSGEYCNNQGDLPTNLCEKLGVASGKACNPTVSPSQCPSHEFCNTNNKCELKKKSGDTCTLKNAGGQEEGECLSGICMSSICGCAENNECGSGFFCDNTDNASGQNTDKCESKYGADEPCADGENDVCQSGLCENGKCTAPTAEQAGATEIKSIELPNFLGETDFAVVIGRVISWIIGLIGSAALAMFLYGGTLWLISRGEDKMIKQGRDTMVWAGIGLIVVFTSFIIINFILKVLGSTAGG
ncbi:hypothetical protein HZB94_02480 [Candidatus Falkowbacteria bacterium]|nr:hypothetical protein [Candidatus Falkowbacteria bacterium]